MKIKISWSREDDDFEFDAEGDFTFDQAHVLIAEVVGDGIVIEKLEVTELTIITQGDGLSDELIEDILDALNGDADDDMADNQDDEPVD